MSHEKKLPPFRIQVTNLEFNKLLSMVSDDNELKDKIIKYSLIKEEDKVELRLFPKEIQNLFIVLFNNLKEVEINKNYIELVKAYRKKYIENKLKESDYNA